MPLDDTVERLVLHKASLICGSARYREYLTEVLQELEINNPIDASLVGAVDAMIYDVACALDFTKQKGHISDWSSWRKRKATILKAWKQFSRNV